MEGRYEKNAVNLLNEENNGMTILEMVGSREV